MLLHILRALFACFVLIVIPHSVTPYLYSMIEEFGIEAPRLLQFFFAVCDLIIRTAFVSIPITLAAIVGLEYFVYRQQRDRITSSVSLLFTLFLIGFVLVVVILFLLPVVAIIKGLSG